jgi:hypothetical protein
MAEGLSGGGKPARPPVHAAGLRTRARAAAIHLLISAAVAGLAAILVFFVWYPGAFRLMAGGQNLFLLVCGVDVVIGPVLTFAVFDTAKGWKHLRRDLAVIGLLQAAALAYGMHTVYIARPVAMVFEVDRFRLVTANAVAVEELPKALAEFRELPLSGPQVIGARRPEAGAERNEAMMAGVNGVDVGQRPIFWQPYAMAQTRAVERSRPIAALLEHYSKQAAELKLQLAGLRADEASARFLPVLARGDWVAVIDKSGAVLGYLQVDGFF